MDVLVVCDLAWASTIAWVQARDTASPPCAAMASETFKPIGAPSPLKVAYTCCEGSLRESR